MPPKAASKRPAPAGETRAAKKRTAAVEAPNFPKSKRWAALSASRNADEDFKLAVQDVERANAYICLCKPHFLRDDKSEDEDEYDSESDSKDEEGLPKPVKDDEGNECDGGDTCRCQKPASEHPEHECILTYAGFRKWMAQRSMATVRNPDIFGMHTWNDHEAQGLLEICQNLILDWVEAKSWQEQWAVCEGFVFFLLDEGNMFYTVDDGSQADETAQIIGRLFLTMLARLETQNLLNETSSVKNLGLIMALFIKFADSMRFGSLLEDDEEETIAKFTWVPSNFDAYINAYSTKYGITLYVLPNMDGLTAKLDTDVTLPRAESSWGWDKAFKAFQKRYSRAPPVGPLKVVFGGDSLDITTWSSAERKSHSFNNKDPLKSADLKSLKEGEVMRMG